MVSTVGEGTPTSQQGGVGVSDALEAVTAVRATLLNADKARQHRIETDDEVKRKRF